MSGEIKVLPTFRNAVCGDAVQALEEALELAKAGKVEDLSLVLHVNDGGETSVMYRGTRPATSPAPWATWSSCSTTCWTTGEG